MDTLFFIASKLAGFALRAEALLLLLLLLGLWFQRRYWTGLAAWCFRLSVAWVLVVGLLPIGGALLGPLENKYPPPDLPADIAGIVVLGGAEDVGASIAWNSPLVNEAGDRYLAAIALAQQFPEAPVLFAGGSGELFAPEISEASIAGSVFTASGIAPDRLIQEGGSRNTAENAVRLKAILGEGEERPWILVTSAYHMPRAVETFCAAGWTDIIPFPTDYRWNRRWMPSWSFPGNLDILNAAIKEWAGILAYRWTGRSQEPGPKCIATTSYG
ncbi:YdcF family protein [Ovoidimarina sediminis]|uniref:YdcF family protein n=1 Tax=Ovoidimarina sediminis TaxID=3079856 RepID=UPI0029074872|nr:YdcF family protein [Rhodophyticola sp. MJ-SS7]MDU8946135.1 YdcF family protein [Rhodophyticola sp. MJ-SS7]